MKAEVLVYRCSKLRVNKWFSNKYYIFSHSRQFETSLVFGYGSEDKLIGWQHVSETY
jgi:hypothetical protein